MLAAIGVASLDELADRALPASIRDRDEEAARGPAGARPRRPRPSRSCARSPPATTLTVPMIGLGYSGTVTPPAIRRNVLENPAWYTAYTPYQPEISQGRLEALLTFQTTVADLTGLPVAGASLLDEATAAAEAMTLLRRAGKAKTRAVRRRRRHAAADARGAAHPRRAARHRAGGRRPGRRAARRRAVRPAAVLPGRVGRGPRPVGADRRGARARRAGRRGRGPAGADAADPARRAGRGRRRRAPRSGSGCRWASAGPHAGYLSVRQAFARQLPGRLVGLSRDADGNPALRLALQTREQHIRREKATSNICTAQVLLAVVAACYAVYHGPDGLRRIAQRCHRMAAVLAAGPAGRRRRGRARRVLRHGAGAGAGPGGRRSSPRRTRPGSRCAGWTPTPSGSPAPS